MDELSAQDIKKSELNELKFDAYQLDVFLSAPDLLSEEISQKYSEIENEIGTLTDLCPALSPKEVAELRKTFADLKKKFCGRAGSETLCDLLNKPLNPLADAEKKFQDNLEELKTGEMTMDKFLESQKNVIDSLGPEYREMFGKYLEGMSGKYEGLENLGGFISAGASGLGDLLSSYYEMFQYYAEGGEDKFAYWWTNVKPSTMLISNLAEYFSKPYGVIGKIASKPIASGLEDLLGNYLHYRYPEAQLPSPKIKEPHYPVDPDNEDLVKDQVSLSNIEENLDKSNTSQRNENNQANSRSERKPYELEKF